MKIEATIIDVSTDAPTSRDNFFVDSNVWFWLTYSRLQTPAISLMTVVPKQYQLKAYPTYINKAIQSKSRLLSLPLILPELAHIIEKNEYEIYAKRSTTPAGQPKTFRHSYPLERANVLQEIEDAWNTVQAYSTLIPMNVDAQLTDDALAQLKTCGIDGYDSFFVSTLKINHIDNILTDDADYATVAGINVFTANNWLIQNAKKQKKLVIRY